MTQENRLMTLKQIEASVRTGMSHQDQTVNRRNDRWLYADPTEVSIVMWTKFPATVMAYSIVRSKGHVMTPLFFPQSLRVNADGYVETLQTIVKPWIDSAASERPYVF
ncbi:unnamed protein product [Hymenolepis diminuta]|uniref:Transposase n=1 Tax=Hymenolepis diminuta TaxID=6216 RepID=A0A0R3SJV0_HYMDI|nr:unnamed protein product [Hymenolepis diminuta]